MIQIMSNEPLDFEYDAKNLVMAFFPGVAVRVTVAGEVVKTECPDGEEEIRCYLSSKTPFQFQWEPNGYKKEFYPDGNRLSDRTYFKNAWKRFVYQCLSDITRRTLPWGTLTGIRPTKLPLQRMLQNNEDLTSTKSWMREQFICSEEKTELGVSIAKREYELIKGIDREQSYSLYVGVPFCPTTCSYCSFASYSMERFGDWMEAYADALVHEIAGCADVYRERKLISVYIGGGTPTTLSAEQLQRVIRELKLHFPMDTIKEFTVEAGRPDSITREKLEVLKEEGVTRISVNPQTMYQPTLDLIGRRHTVEQTKQAFLLARELGFDNINMDLIVGLPEETPEVFRQTLGGIRELNPDSITIHSLVVKRASKLREWKDLHKEEQEEIDYVDEMQQMGYDYCRLEGYAPYYMYRQKHKAALTGASVRENVGYARRGKEGIYNIMIMEEIHSILALGAGASSKIVYPKTGRIDRIENVKSVTDYIERVDEMIARKDFD